jgi:hypothetical protein
MKPKKKKKNVLNRKAAEDYVKRNDRYYQEMNSKTINEEKYYECTLF